MKKLVSIIIPAYNEEKVIKACFESLNRQTYKPLEIVVVDDGSTDKTLTIISNFKFPFRLETRSRRAISNFKLFRQKHLGPGPARNLGAKKARGEILVFLDADMTFDRSFIRDLVKPIHVGKTIGTFSKNEMVENYENIWSICWNINRNLPPERMLPQSYPDQASVFRAILKSEFEKVDGFDATGEYTDDWSLSRKLGIKSTVAKGAIYYHSNPATLKEVWQQAHWIGKNEFLSGTFVRKIRSLIFYSLPISIIVGFVKSFTNSNLSFFIFKLVYNSAIWASVVKSFFGEAKSK